MIVEHEGDTLEGGAVSLDHTVLCSGASAGFFILRKADEGVLGSGEIGSCKPSVDLMKIRGALGDLFYRHVALGSQNQGLSAVGQLFCIYLAVDLG